MDVKCARCGIPRRIMKRCVCCKSVVYCSRQCQIQDWPRHKLQCFIASSSCTTSTTENTSVGFNANAVSRVDEEHRMKSSTYSPGKDQRNQMNYTDVEQSPRRNEQEIQPNSSINQEPICNIVVKCQRDKHSIHINLKWEASQMLSHISDRIHIPLEKLKLVHKGKLVDEGNVQGFLKNKALFQAIGEVSESEYGLDTTQVDCVVSKLGVDRNEAVRALRLKGDVIDAILYLGNK